MELMESQYAQYYAMSAVPPFDPSAQSLDPSLVAAIPNLVIFPFPAYICSEIRNVILW